MDLGRVWGGGQIICSLGAFSLDFEGATTDLLTARIYQAKESE